MNISSQLPPELWDLIFNFLTGKNLARSKLISHFYCDLIYLNRNLKYRAILWEVEEEKFKFYEILIWLSGTNHHVIHENNISSKERLKAIKWLYSTFNQTKKIFDTWKENFAYMAARNGHLNIVMWANLITDITEYNMDNYRSLLGASAAGGQLEILKWIYDNHIKDDDNKNVSSTYFLAFEEALHNLELKAMKWLYNTFNFKGKNMSYNYNYFAESISESFEKYDHFFPYGRIEDKLKILKWLNNTINNLKKKEQLEYDEHYRRFYSWLWI